MKLKPKRDVLCKLIFAKVKKRDILVPLPIGRYGKLWRVRSQRAFRANRSASQPAAAPHHSAYFRDRLRCSLSFLCSMFAGRTVPRLEECKSDTNYCLISSGAKVEGSGDWGYLPEASQNGRWPHDANYQLQKCKKSLPCSCFKLHLACRLFHTVP